MCPSASTTEKFICATGTPWKNSASSRLSGWFGLRAEDLQEEPAVVGETLQAQ